MKESKILSSRFIGILEPLLGVDFKSALSNVEAAYPKATHYCYAYKKGATEGNSDDGEPSHSAGLPILNVLRGSGLDECAIFVVRYFGGTKLGLGRLTHAYADLAKDLAREARPFLVEKGKKLTLRVPYSSYDLLLDRAKREGLTAGTPVFEEDIHLPLTGNATILKNFLGLFPKLTVESEEDAYVYKEIES